MCIDCHKNQSDEDMIDQHRKRIDDPQFERWNSMSLSHLFITALGFNGREGQTICIKIIDNLREWIAAGGETKSSITSYPPTLDSMDKMIDYIKKYYETEKCQKETKDNIDKLLEELFTLYEFKDKDQQII